MARIESDQPLVPSVLDRLIDEDPTRTTEPAKSRSQVLRELKHSVRRDLENLLNTRWRCMQWPSDLEELEVSLINYGIPDFTGVNMSQMSERENLRAVVERIIRKFEPRFKQVRVNLVQNKEEFDRSLKLNIEALMYADPDVERVEFESLLEPTSSSFEIKGR